MRRVISFDLSSKCIGVNVAEAQEKEIIKLHSIPIIPKKPTGKDVGFTTDNPKKVAYNGIEFNAFLYPGEFSISKTQAEKRKRNFKHMQHNYLLRNIGQQCGMIINKLKPDEVCFERNSSFNGILTTKLLAEIAGGLYFFCGAKGIPIYDHNEAVVRSFIRKTIANFSYENKDGMVAIDTKWEIACRLRVMLGHLIDFSKLTLDETDAMAVLYYHVVKGDHKIYDNDEC